MNQVRVAPSGIEGQTSAPYVQPVQMPTNVQQPLTTMNQAPQPTGPTPFMTQPVHAVPTPQYTNLPPIGQASMPPPAPAQMYVQPAPSWQMAPPQRGPVVLQLNPRNTSSRKIEDYNSARSKTLGVLQLVFGGIALIFNVVGIIVQSKAYDATNEYDFNSDYYGSYDFDDSDGYYVSPTIWGGVFFALSGAFALCSAAKKTYCLIVTQMIMGIIASVCAFITLFIAIWIITEDAHRISKGFNYEIYPNYNYNGSFNHIGYSDKAERYATGCMAVSVLFLLSSIPIVVVTVWSSTLGCKICCSDIQQSDSEQVQYQSNMGGGQPQVLVLDRRGRPVPGAQIIPIPGPSVEQAPLMQAQSLQQPAVDSKNPGLLPPPYE